VHAAVPDATLFQRPSTPPPAHNAPLARQKSVSIAAAVRNAYADGAPRQQAQDSHNPSNATRPKAPDFATTIKAYRAGTGLNSRPASPTTSTVRTVFAPEAHVLGNGSGAASRLPAAAATLHQAPQQQVFNFVPPSLPSSLDQSEQDRLLALRLQEREEQEAADAQLAARLAAGEDFGSDSGYFASPGDRDDPVFIGGDGIEEMDMDVSMLEVQRNLLAAFAAQAEEREEQEMPVQRLQREYQDEHARQIEEQAEYARRNQEEWAEAVMRQEQEDRELAETLRREAEEELRREEEELEALRRMLEAEREEEERLLREEEERARRERMADCVVCAEEFEKTDMLMLPCEHAYCTGEDCLSGMPPHLLPEYCAGY
jgi:hypothetical protein